MCDRAWQLSMCWISLYNFGHPDPRATALLTGKGKYAVIDTASVSRFDWAIGTQLKISRCSALIECSGQGGEELDLEIDYWRSACELITNLEHLISPGWKGNRRTNLLEGFYLQSYKAGLLRYWYVDIGVAWFILRLKLLSLPFLVGQWILKDYGYRRELHTYIKKSNCFPISQYLFSTILAAATIFLYRVQKIQLLIASAIPVCEQVNRPPGTPRNSNQDREYVRNLPNEPASSPN